MSIRHALLNAVRIGGRAGAEAKGAVGIPDGALLPGGGGCVVIGNHVVVDKRARGGGQADFLGVEMLKKPAVVGAADAAVRFVGDNQVKLVGR